MLELCDDFRCIKKPARQCQIYVTFNSNTSRNCLKTFIHMTLKHAGDFYPYTICTLKGKLILFCIWRPQSTHLSLYIEGFTFAIFYLSQNIFLNFFTGKIVYLHVHYKAIYTPVKF